MNRRNALKSVIAGAIAAVWPWKVTRVPIEFGGAFFTGDIRVDERPWPMPVECPCWNCGRHPVAINSVCPHCGFDSRVQADGSYLVPPRFNEYLSDMVS